MKVTVIRVVIGVLATVTKGLGQRLEDSEIRRRVETIQTTATDRAEYWEEFWKLEETCCHSDSRGRPSANTCVKNSQMSKIIIPIINVCGRLAQTDYKTMQLGGKGNPLGNVQETEIWPCNQMVYAQTIIRTGKGTHKILWDFEIQMDYLIPATDQTLWWLTKKKKKKKKKEKKRKIWRTVDYAFPANNRVKIKESGKIKCLDLARELRKL